jgi:hypothetical protein
MEIYPPFFKFSLSIGGCFVYNGCDTRRKAGNIQFWENKTGKKRLSNLEKEKKLI